MDFRVIFVLVVVGVTICCVQCLPAPRDNTVVKNQEVIRADDGTVGAVTKNEYPFEAVQTTVMTVMSSSGETEKQEIIFPHQLSCQYKEPTEDLVCQEHCLPKGYAYGLCIGHKCSCI